MTSNRNNFFKKIGSSYRSGGSVSGVATALIFLFIIGTIVSRNFFTGYNITIMSRDLAFIGIVAIAQGILLLLGDIDLSIGSIAGVAAVLTSVLIVDFNVNFVISMIVGLLVGFGLGLINGTLGSTFNLNPLVLTIGTQTAFLGLNFVITKGRTITGLPEAATRLGTGSVFKIPIPVYFLAVVFIIIYILLNHTVFGRRLYAMGNNREAGIMVGINKHQIRILAFAIAGVLAALAGSLMAFRTISAQTSIGATWVMPSIAAPVIGGIATTGGVGSITGAIIGAALVTLISNIIVLGGVNVYWQQVFNGVIVILAIIMDSFLRKANKRNL
ncbi:MAG: ABC transporter permease [Clostridiales bacterium]|nr:ABC transporter permease [Clostridiales bacterium]